jgi:glucose-1-phosphate cytidylyltransferase
MKAVLLAGGKGTRLSEETVLRPKPMVEIGGKPILWHIMKIYSHYGVNDFIICLGYRGYMIKEYFYNYYLHSADVSIDMNKNAVEYHNSRSEPWRVTLVDTGDETMTGGRVKRIVPHLGSDETFCMTYGDGVSNVDIQELIAFHREAGRVATVTAVQPEGRFGALELEDTRVARFREKPAGDGAWINGGFFVLEPGAIDYCVDDAMAFERQPLEDLAAAGQLSAFRHSGFWHPMDTVRDRNHLESLWQAGPAPWKTWE